MKTKNSSDAAPPPAKARNIGALHTDAAPMPASAFKKDLRLLEIIASSSQ
jgi:hypothetical protein